MAGIVGQGTTFNLPNFVGDLFSITPSDTPLLSRIGGLTGGEQTNAKLFDWGFYDLRAPGDRTRVEGANAPSAEERVRETAFNVVEIHQEAVEISYTKQAATGQLGTGTDTRGAGNQVNDELEWQVDAALVQMALDVEWSFINQTFANPATNATPRKTRGLLAAITTNVTDAVGGALTEDMVLDTMQNAWTNGGLQEGETRTIMVGAALKRALTTIFITNKGYAQGNDRNIAGVNLTRIETDFGLVDIMLNRHMPADDVVIASLEDLAPVFLLIPGKGFLFVEELAKVGAAERRQLYGEVGLKSGNERKHAKIINAIP